MSGPINEPIPPRDAAPPVESEHCDCEDHLQAAMSDGCRCAEHVHYERYPPPSPEPVAGLREAEKMYEVWNSMIAEGGYAYGYQGVSLHVWQKFAALLASDREAGT